mgnify:CR=1 FL=1
MKSGIKQPLVILISLNLADTCVKVNCYNCLPKTRSDHAP